VIKGTRLPGWGISTWGSSESDHRRAQKPQRVDRL